MRCEDLDPVIEGVADDTLDPGVDVRAHLTSCSLCKRRLQAARAIHELLSTREAPVPPPGFTARVIARVQRQRWQAERAIDIGFNVAVAAGILLILGGGLGLAWSMGFLSLDVDLGVLLEAGAAEWTGRLEPQIQTIAMAAVLLTMALGLWWWAETDLSL